MVVTSAPMWTSTRFTERFGCRYPIAQGPMGGGASTPELSVVRIGMLSLALLQDRAGA